MSQLQSLGPKYNNKLFLYLLDQNIREYHKGTRPSKYFQPLHLVLPVNLTDEQVLHHAIKNDQTIITNDKLFVIENLINQKSVIFQDNYEIRYYLKIKDSFVFDFVNYDSVETFPLRKKDTILQRIRKIIKRQKPIVPNQYSYLVDFGINNKGLTRPRKYFVYCTNIFSYELSRKKHDEQTR